jgi:hypothetical protein
MYMEGKTIIIIIIISCLVSSLKLTILGFKTKSRCVMCQYAVTERRYFTQGKLIP